MRTPGPTAVRRLIVCGAVLLTACTSGAAATTSATSLPASTDRGTTPASSTTNATQTTNTTRPTTTTTPLTVTGAVVRVANCSGRPAAATHLSDALAEKGFTLAPATNGFGPEARLDHTKVYALKGAEQVALSVSRVLGGVKVLPMPVPAWIDGGTAALGDTKVLVMLGRDLGNQPLPATVSG
jgi:hypothetical protein